MDEYIGAKILVGRIRPKPIVLRIVANSTGYFAFSTVMTKTFLRECEVSMEFRELYFENNIARIDNLWEVVKYVTLFHPKMLTGVLGIVNFPIHLSASTHLLGKNKICFKCSPGNSRESKFAKNISGKMMSEYLISAGFKYVGKYLWIHEKSVLQLRN